LVLKGDTGFGSLTDASVRDPAFAAMRQRVHITEDPAMTAATPRLRPARVTVTLKDGRRSTHTCDSPRGDFNRPYEESEIREKFRELAGLMLTPQGVAAVEQEVDRSDQWTSVCELTNTLRKL
jgi:2-methylcitrate dehydratase PrpD